MNDPAPINVSITTAPPKVMVGGVDITNEVDSFNVEFVGGEMWATFAVKADAQVEFPCHVQRIDPAGDVLAGLDAETLTNLVASCPMSLKVGDHLLTHLRMRLGGAPT